MDQIAKLRRTRRRLIVSGAIIATFCFGWALVVPDKWAVIAMSVCATYITTRVIELLTKHEPLLDD